MADVNGTLNRTGKQNAIEQAMFAFWQSIANSYPMVKHGDLSPEQFAQFEQACYSAVTQWLKTNRNGQTATNWIY